MITYLDGNNLLGSSRPAGGLDDRERFAEYLQRCRFPRPSCLVFDGPPPVSGVSVSSRRGRLSVVYSGKRTADEVILSRIRPGDRVVTSDRDLAAGSRDRRATVVSAEAFLGDLKPLGGEAPEKPLSVNRRELREWMDVFGEDGAQ